MSTTEQGTIFFTEQEIQAIQDGRMTAFLRPVPDVEDCTHLDRLEDGWRFSYQDGDAIASTDKGSPYGERGDWLEVRRDLVLPECEACGLAKTPQGRAAPRLVIDGFCDWWCDGYTKPPMPGCYWPNEPAGFWLCVNRVEPKRLQDIGEADLRDLAVAPIGPRDPEAYNGDPWQWLTERWDSANRNYPAESNPWVWHVPFRVFTEREL